jgi:mono/diheme cytochrome c family protein
MRMPAILVVAFRFYASAQAQDLPAGRGPDVMSDACGECHGAERVTSASKNREDWGVAVTRMLTKSGRLPLLRESAGRQ